MWAKLYGYTPLIQGVIVAIFIWLCWGGRLLICYKSINNWRTSMLNLGCMRLTWRVCVRVTLFALNDVVFWSCFCCFLYTYCFLLTCKMACKIWVVNYPMYIALTNGSSIFLEKKNNDFAWTKTFCVHHFVKLRLSCKLWIY